LKHVLTQLNEGHWRECREVADLNLAEKFLPAQNTIYRKAAVRKGGVV